MNRRGWWVSILVAVAGCSGEAPIQRSDRPHVIVYLIDTLRADHLGAYGYEHPTSPNLDRFASESVTFETALAPSSWTKSSVGSLFTGLFPARHGALRREHRLRADVPTLAEILKAEGYVTAAFVSNPNILPVFGFERGFDDFYDIESIERSATAAQVHASVLDYLADAGRSSKTDAPLFLYIHTRDPHDPYEPPQPFDQRFAVASEAEPGLAATRALYDGEIAYNDDELGRLFEKLDQLGIYDNAIIALVSDHGEEFGDHGGIGHGKTLFREQLHVPLILRLPRGRAGNTRVETPVRLLDVLPTVCELVGVEAPPEIDGQSFTELFRAGAATYEPVHYAQLNLDRHLISALTTDRYKLIERRLPVEERGVQLFDRVQDPDEENDLAAERSDVAAELSRQLAAVEAALTGGGYLEAVNALSSSKPATITGSIELANGTFADWSLEDGEEGDRVQLVGERELRFTFELENRLNPIGQEPLVIRDVDRIHFIVEPTDTELRLRLNGKPPVLLGAVVDAASETPIALGATDPRLAAPSVGLVQEARPPWQHLRLFTVTQPESAPAEIDKELDQRLRSLGYLG